MYPENDKIVYTFSCSRSPAWEDPDLNSENGFCNIEHGVETNEATELVADFQRITKIEAILLRKAPASEYAQKQTLT